MSSQHGLRHPATTSIDNSYAKKPILDFTRLNMTSQPVLEEPEFCAADLNYTSNWTTITQDITHKANAILKAFVKGTWKKRRINRFLLSEDDIDDGDDASSHWEPVRFLGQGSWGRCGVWKKVNAQREIIDEVVIKEAKKYELHVQRYVGSEIQPFILREASMQRDIQRQERRLMARASASPQQLPQAIKDRHIVHLRRYKYNTRASTARFYMQHAAWGTLSTLFERYDAWSTAFNELFLWHIFTSLARACIAMCEAPHETSIFRSLQRRNRNDFEPDQWYSLHLDMKPDNVFLGKPWRNPQQSQGESHFDPTADYPSILLGDWGFARYASVNPDQDEQNPYLHRAPGTPGWRAPEQTRLMGEFWDNPPIDDAIYSALNIYAVGKIMHDLMVHPRGYEGPDLVDNMMVDIDEQGYLDNQRHFLPADYSTGRRPEYSDELRDLVRQCISPRPSDRPNEQELESSTIRGLRNLIVSLERAGPEDRNSTRVWFSNNEINDMPLGNEDWSADEYYHTFVRDTEDPDYPLQLPLPKWSEYPRRKMGLAIAKDVRPRSPGHWQVDLLSDDSSSEPSDASGNLQEDEPVSHPLEQETESSSNVTDPGHLHLQPSHGNDDQEKSPPVVRQASKISTKIFSRDQNETGFQQGQYPSPYDNSQFLAEELASAALKEVLGKASPGHPSGQPLGEEPKHGCTSEVEIDKYQDQVNPPTVETRQLMVIDSRPEAPHRDQTSQHEGGGIIDDTAPSTEQYTKGMTIEDMKDELWHRGRELPPNKPRPRKSEYVRRLMAADRAGAVGRCIHKRSLPEPQTQASKRPRRK